MASAGTLLSDLGNGSNAPVRSSDDDLVSRILADMNQPSQSNPIINHSAGMQAPPPPMPSTYGNQMIQSPNPNTTYPTAIDPATATAHMIGKEYPTPVDFANMMHAPNYSQGYGQGHGGSMFASAAPQHMAPPAPTLVDPYKGNLYSEIIAQLKQPLLVAIIVFVVSLPALNVLIGHYVPSLLRMGGDLTTAGLAVRAAFGGFLFWFAQKVIVPLMVV